MSVGPVKYLGFPLCACVIADTFLSAFATLLNTLIPGLQPLFCASDADQLTTISTVSLHSLHLTTQALVQQSSLLTVGTVGSMVALLQDAVWFLT